MTAREHVLLRPEMYVGPLQVQERTLWVWDDVKKRIVCRDVKYVPGLLKIFDEILVNAADNQARDQPRAAKMSYIDVKINAKKGEICVENDGSALPVAIHPAEMIYVPELVFGHLLTSSNFDDERERFTGGRHGCVATECLGLRGLPHSRLFPDTEPNSSTSSRTRSTSGSMMRRASSNSISSLQVYATECVRLAPS